MELYRVNIDSAQGKFVINDFIKFTKKYQKSIVGEFVGGMPITLEIQCTKPLFRVLPDGNFAYNMTLKVDGSRYLLFLTSQGELYFIDRNLNIFQPRRLIEKTFGIWAEWTLLPVLNSPQFLVDGELVERELSKKLQQEKGLETRDILNIISGEFLLFDILYVDNKSVVKLPFTKRYQYLPYIAKILNQFLGSINEPPFIRGDNEVIDPEWLTFSVKQFFDLKLIASSNNIYRTIEQLTNKNRSRSKKLKADGIVLQPIDTPYVTTGPWNKKNNIQFKWKPVRDQTVDLLIKEVHEAGVNDFELVLAQKSEQTFTLGAWGYPATSIVSRSVFGGIKPIGKVGEFSFNLDRIKQREDATGKDKKKLLKFLKVRVDKSANSYWAAESVLKFAMSPFTLEVLKGPIKAIMKGDMKAALSGLLMTDLLKCCYARGYIFTRKELDIIKTDFNNNRHTKNVEFEFRLGKLIEKNFSPNIRRDKFNFLIDTFKDKYKYTKIHTLTLHKGSLRTTYYISDPSNIKLHNPIQTEIKQRISPGFTSDLGKVFGDTEFRLSVSKEEIVGEIVTEQNYDLARLRERTTFYVGSWNVDLTEVNQGKEYFSLSESNKKFEIEAEYSNPLSLISEENFVDSCDFIVKKLLYNLSPC